MSNRERLENAGILEPKTTLTDEQYRAIEDLHETEVDQLISIKDKLAHGSIIDPPVQPGINPVGPLEGSTAA
ncbi:MAG: aroma-sacti cluster domain-containing protein [Pyrinomonadaceae bacterium]